MVIVGITETATAEMTWIDQKLIDHASVIDQKLIFPQFSPKHFDITSYQYM